MLPAEPINYQALYEQQLRRSSELELELALLQEQTSLYARDLASVYRHAKGKRRELADTNLQLLKYATDLRNSLGQLKHSNSHLQAAYHDTISRLSLAAEYRDKDTGTHISRMCYFSVIMAEHMQLPPADIRNIFYGAPMHDVGKIGIPDHIILKPSRLNKAEFEIMKRHVVIGSDILSNAKAEILRIAQHIALWHHERWDGGGYPHGLKRQEIPRICRVISVADVFDALISQRPYKEAMSVEQAHEIITEGREKQFDPEAVDAFCDCFERLLRTRELVNSGREQEVFASFTTTL